MATRCLKVFISICFITTVSILISTRWKKLQETVLMPPKLPDFRLSFSGLMEKPVIDEQINETDDIPLTEPSPLVSGRDAVNSDGRCPYGAYYYAEKFCVWPYWKKRKLNAINATDVTLCTQSTPEFLYHLSIQCSRWTGPISVAVYIPDYNWYEVTITIIETLRHCEKCLRDWADWHLVFEPDPQFINDNMVVDDDYDCNNPKEAKKYLTERNGTYPINAVRNVARNHTVSSHVLLLDIELYPSLDVRTGFNLMIGNMSETKKKNRVFVLPVFEVWSKFTPPKTKQELRKMFYRKAAISFHKYQCPMCHEIPQLKEWMNFTTTSTDAPQPLTVWKTVKRNKKYKLDVWEPFFIGTKSDPAFDVRLTWEGKANKMQVAYQMCLMNYDFSILDEAFLVHSPGVKIYSWHNEKFRFKYMFENNNAMKIIKQELWKKYGRKQSC